MLRMKRSQCVDNKQHNTSMISLLQYLFSILVILVHSGRLFSQDVIHFTFKSFLGRMAVPYFLICTAFFLRGRIQQGLCNHSYFRKLIKKYSMWTIIYLPYGYFFFESLNIAKIYLLPGFIVAFLYLGMSHTLWYIPAVILGWVIIQGLLKYVGTRGTFITVVVLYCIGAVETYSVFIQSTKFYPLMSTYMSIFQTTRNGLFYTPVYLLAGYLLYDYFNTDLFTKSRGLKYILFLLLLALENVLIYFNQGLDKNFFLLAPLRNHLQSQTELLVFSPNQELLFASNSHLGNFFSKSIYISEVLDKAKINQRLLKIIVDSEGGHYLALIKPIIVNKKVSGYAFLLMNGKDFLLPTKAINSDLIIADQLNNSFTFTNRDFISSSLDKVDSQFLTRYFSFHDHRAFVVRKVALQDNILLYMYRPLIPVTLVVLFSLVSSVIIFVILRQKSRVLADRIAVKNSSAINQMVLDMDAISRQEKSSIELDSQDEFQYLSVQINQMVSQLKDLHEKTLDLETQKLLFEKRMLEAQFNPHFLYNTLETILITSHYDSQLTERIVIQLTKLLRYSLSGSTEAAVLKDDLAIIESYLLINQVRFEELTYTISVSPELEHMRVPKLFLLPLIENAIKYGLKERHDVAINIDIWQDSDGIWFTVSNNGSGISLARQQAIRTMLRSTHSHHGLINSYRRLQYQFSTVLLEFTKTDDAFRVSYIVKE